MSKKFIRVLVSPLILIFLLSACNKDVESSKEKEKVKEPKEMKVALLVDSFALDDGSINQKSYKGLKEFEIDTSSKITYRVSKSDSDFEDDIDKLVEEGASLIWGAGPQTATSIKEASYNYKDIHFSTLDNPFDDSSMPSNLTGTIFKTEETSYLLGYIAGYITESNKLGYLGGDKGALSDKNEYGFRAGVLDAAKERKLNLSVSSQYIGNFSDKDKGRTLANNIYDTDVDIIYTDAGLGNLGAIEASKEQDKFLLVNEEGLLNLAPERVILAAVKNYEEVINSLSSRFIIGDQIGGRNYELGLRDKALNISAFNHEQGLISKAVYDKALMKKKEIEDGKKIVPNNEESFNKYYSIKK